MKKRLLVGFFALFTVILAACGGEEESAEGLLSDGKLTVGVTAGPHEEIMEKVAELGAEEGLDIELQVFSDYIMPNRALSEGEIDLNSFQTEPFLDDANAERDLGLVKVADTVTFPMGIYSDKVTDLGELKDGAVIGFPNDPTQGGRALLLFEQAGLITLKEDAGVSATANDIVKNPHNFEFLELDAAQLPVQLGELDAAAINSNFAMEAGLIPGKDSIFVEQDSPYVNLLVTREEDKDDEAVQQIIDLYHSDEVKQFIEERFEGSVIPSW